LSPALFFTTVSLSLSLATLAGARRNPIPVAPAWVAVLVTVLALGGLLWRESLCWAATGLAAVGLLAPALVMARVRTLSGRGEYGAAARLLRRLLIVRRSDALTGWARVWESANALVHGDAAPADRLVAEWRDVPAARASREWLVGIRWRWADALESQTPDLRIRAACETGDVEGAVALCMQQARQRPGPAALARQRLAWLAPIAFSGRVSATEMLCSLLRVPEPLTEIWRATALSGAGQAAEARQRLDALSERRDLSDGLRYLLSMRRGHLPEPVALSPAAQDHLVRFEREIMAGAVLRLRLPKQAPRTLGLLVAIVLVYCVEIWRGGTMDARVAWELGALLPAHAFPEEPARLITYAFLHHGPLHLVLNGFTIALIGATVEAAIGGWRMIAIYAGATIGAGLSISYFGGEEITLGASGAAMGLMGAVGVIAARDRRTRGTRTGRNIGLAIAALVLLQSSLDASMPEISFAGHLGGAVCGALLALLLVRGSGAGTLHRE
jgi:rhomboid protease GluP